LHRTIFHFQFFNILSLIIKKLNTSRAVVTICNTFHRYMYTTHLIKSWHEYQRVHSSDLHTIADYNRICEEDALLYGAHVMVLRDNVTKVNGFYCYGNGWPAQNCADTAGYVDVRTGKHYDLQGENSFFKAMHK